MNVSKNRRNVTLERMLENNPNKTKCKFDGCDFKRSDAEALKRHEDGCENRFVPCARCDEKISQRGLAQHVVVKHFNGEKDFQVDSLGDVQNCFANDILEKEQAVISVTGDDCHEFLMNWCPSDDDFTLFWVAYIGKKGLSSNYKYTLQVESKEQPEKYLFEGTRNCIPCDLSHTDVKK